MTNQSPNSKVQIKFIQSLFIVILLVISYSRLPAGMASFVISPVFAQTTEAVDIGSNVKDFFGFTCIQHFVFRIVDIGIILSGLLLLVYFIWGGIEWLTSGGDKQKVSDARNKLTNALIGVAIIAASYAIWRLALVFFGVDLTNICSSNPIPS